MLWIAPTIDNAISNNLNEFSIGGDDANFRLWLKADLQPPENEVRFTPRTRHSSTDTVFWFIPTNSPQTSAMLLTARLRWIMNYGTCDGEWWSGTLKGIGKAWDNRDKRWKHCYMDNYTMQFID